MICSRCGKALTTTAGCPNVRCWDEPPKHPYRCPVCNGTGKVSRPPGVPGDQRAWAATGTAAYDCHAVEPSVLRGTTVYRCPLWPMGATGPAPVAPHVERQARRGPRNVLVADSAGRRFVLPFRTLRRVRP